MVCYDVNDDYTTYEHSIFLVVEEILPYKTFHIIICNIQILWHFVAVMDVDSVELPIYIYIVYCTVLCSNNGNYIGIFSIPEQAKHSCYQQTIGTMHSVAAGENVCLCL